MRTPLAAAAVLVALCGARPARAEPVLALRLGVAPALGSVAADVPVSDAITTQYPIQLDALWREGSLAGGLYGSWGPARVGRCGDASCSASVTRLGVQATWTFADVGRAEPWVGVASGYEWATQDRTRGGTVTTSWRGFELLAAQGGIEWRVWSRLALGPYALLAVGRYTDVSLDTGYGSASGEIANRAVHAWFHVGVRARLVLGAAR